MSSELKSLSKAALYAPLNDYLKESKSSSNSVSSKLKERALYSFIETVSGEYHSSNTSLGLKYGGNNGGQGLSSRQVENKLARRALCLIKGGIGTSISKSSLEIVDGASSGKKRNRESGWIRLCGSMSKRKRTKKLSKSNVVVPANNPDLDGSILFGLNKIWKKYIETLLGKRLLPESFNSKEAASLVATAEMIGAFVSITESQSCRNYVGKSGIVIDVTRNTWKVAVPKDGLEDLDNIVKCKNLKVLIIPKRDSKLVIKIPTKEESHNGFIRIGIAGTDLKT